MTEDRTVIARRKRLARTFGISEVEVNSRAHRFLADYCDEHGMLPVDVGRGDKPPGRKALERPKPKLGPSWTEY